MSDEILTDSYTEIQRKIIEKIIGRNLSDEMDPTTPEGSLIIEL